MFRGRFIVPNKVKALPVTAIYRAIVIEVERRRLSVGISMEKMSELMGAAERSYSKMIYADTPSGRVAQWQTLQSAIDVLFADGFKLAIEVCEGAPLTSAGARRLIQSEAARWGAPSGKRYMAELGTLAASARRDKISPERRSELARMAARARWDGLEGKARTAATAAARTVRHGKGSTKRLAA